MGTENIVLATNIRYVKDYLVSCEEMLLFDWLVFTQRGFGSAKPFRHSILQVLKATKVSRYKQNKYFDHFAKLGFLTLGKDIYNNSEYHSFFVDYSVLAQPKVLGEIVRKETDTYYEMLNMFSEWANEQTKRERPLTKKEQKANELERESANNLITMSCEPIEERAKKFYNTLIPYLDSNGGEYPEKIINGFYKFWSEPDPSNTKMRFELQKTWEVSRRLYAWNNSKLTNKNMSRDEQRKNETQQYRNKAYALMQQLAAEGGYELGDTPIF